MHKIMMCLFTFYVNFYIYMRHTMHLYRMPKCITIVWTARRRFILWRRHTDELLLCELLLCGKFQINNAASKKVNLWIRLLINSLMFLFDM